MGRSCGLILPVVTARTRLPGPDNPGPPGDLLECVVNVSEGRDGDVLVGLVAACGDCLLDVHSDWHHHRSVFTLAGRSGAVETAVRELARRTVEHVDLRGRSGAHPRIGALDVVPWVAVEGWPLRDAAPGMCLERAVRARQDFGRWAAEELELPIFLYGPERSLPELRRRAWRDLGPDMGPSVPHPTAGAVALGLRPLMVAFNLWTATADLQRARAVAAAVRSSQVRSLAFSLGGEVQVSCNLIAPLVVGPAEAWDRVAAMVPVARAELVGLVPRSVLDKTPEARWAQLDLSPGRTIEARLWSGQRPTRTERPRPER